MPNTDIAASSELHAADDFARQVSENQERLKRELASHYDYIVCGSGSSGSVVARRLADNPDVSVLLLEAGGSDAHAAVTEPGIWFANLGSERDWQFVAEPNSHVNGRSLPLSMGKVLGGGSSINVMIWARGHKTDWDYFAKEADDAAWNYESVLDIYRRIEDWAGEPDPRRGVGGPVFVQPASEPHPIAGAMLDAAASCGISTYADQNGRMMEGPGGAALANVRIRDGKRLSVFRSYVYPAMARPNLTVLCHALVNRILFEGNRATGVEVDFEGQVVRISARKETILSLGAINTPKVLMQSGIGPEEHLAEHGIPVVQNLPGVGQNFQDHIMVAGLVWEAVEEIMPRNNLGEATFFWSSEPDLPEPDIQAFIVEIPITTPEASAKFNPTANCWSVLPGLTRPKSRGQITITGPNPTDPVRIEANALSHPDDLKALVRGVQISRDIGNATALSQFVKREVMPGAMDATDLEDFVRATASTVWHQSCTAKMGTDAMSVVDAKLKVYGLDGLRIADASIMPRVTTGNTMAPCVIIGERMAEILAAEM
ncbi:GMC family oxidoreductase [Agrobacterium sp. CG674]